MAGDLIAGNIGDGTDLVPTTTLIAGVAKAWMNLNGTGTIALRDSFNTSSVTDNGTGDYTQTYSTATASANVAPVLGCRTESAGTNRVTNLVSQTASAVRVLGENYSGTDTDLPEMLVATMGNV